MKKIISLILLMAVAAVYGQSFQISYNGEPVGEELNYIVEQGNEDNGLVVIITNTSNETESILLSKRVISEISGSYNTFHIGDCCDPSITVAPVPFILQPGESSDGNSFHLLYNPCGKEGTTTVEYTFSSGSSSTILRVNYIYSTSGIANPDIRVNSITAYPNPATTSVTVSYELSGSLPSNDVHLVITNLVGSKVAVHSLSGTSGKVVMDLNDLDAGIYFYSIEANGKAVSTRKLIVK